MKKVSILTYHRAINYGAVLQCFALKHIIENLGFETSVLDYNPPVMRKNRSLIMLTDVISFLYSIKMLVPKIRSIRNFNKFISKHLNLKPFDPNNSFQDVDTIVIGSDQVWSPRINSGFDIVYWGDFLPQLRKITYAVSMGTDHKFEPKDCAVIRKKLDNFASISVREYSLASELKYMGVKKEIAKVLDPTLLLDACYYDEIADDNNAYGNYIFYYEIRHDDNTIELLHKLAKFYNCKIVSLLGPRSKFNDVEYIRLNHGDVSVEKFMGLIKHAKYVVTSSFHGTTFSVIYRKNFYSLIHKDCDRARDLLDSIGLADRLVAPLDVCEITDVDYSKASGKLSELISSSLDYLRVNL